MMDASLPADQSGLSDLSAASISSIDPYLGPTSPILDQRPPSPTISAQQTTFQLDPATRMPSTFPAAFTPSPAPSRTKTPLSSAPAWTPSPDASGSRSSTRNPSSHRASPRNVANESVGSSLGIFDYSNTSFSESFLRQAGAHMLAGLDETEQQAPASTSPRYRTSSSPTVTVRPVRVEADPTTPFTGKSLRTRMAEAGMMDSPASSDGSSSVGFSPSVSARVVAESRMEQFSKEGGDGWEQEEEREKEGAWPDSLKVEGQVMVGSSSRSNPDRSVDVESQCPQEGPWGGESARDQLGEEEREGWQEGLSMVLEESYVEDASQLPSSPLLQPNISQASVRSVDRASPSVTRSRAIALRDVPSTPSSPASEQDRSSPASYIAPSQRETGPEPPSPAPHETPSRPIKGQNSASASPSSFSSPQTKPSTPTTPQSLPRTTPPPRSFARLRMVTPARSSPLSRMVNFMPSSAGSTSNWHSPANQRSGGSPEKGVDYPTEGEKSMTSSQQAGLWKGADTSENLHDEVAVQEASMDDEAKQPKAIPQTPRDSKPTDQAAAPGTPSKFWSPATSASFATPASCHSLVGASAPVTPAETFASPASAAFGTPQPVPSPTPAATQAEAKRETEQPQQDINQLQTYGEEEPLSSSSCGSSTSSSSHKQQGDLSTASAASRQASPSPSTNRESRPDFALASQHDSPSAARFSRLQLYRLPNHSSLTIPAALASAPELATVASAFDSFTNLAETRVSRLLTQLSASTARVAELEEALESHEHHTEEVDQLRLTLSGLSAQYEELVEEADRKDREMVELVRKLEDQLKLRTDGGRVEELERQLEEEKRSREVERRDYAVRILGVLSGQTASATAQNDVMETEAGRKEVERAVEQAKEQVRLTLEKDFEIRRTMEQRELQKRISELELQLAPKTDAKREKEELQAQVEQLTSDLDRRFEQLSDLQEELDEATRLKEEAIERAQLLEEELAVANNRSHSSGQEEKEELEAELNTLRETLEEQEEKILHLEETLALTSNRVSALIVEVETLTNQHLETQNSLSTSQARVAELESHILRLKSQLRTPSTPQTPQVKPANESGTSVTPAADRVKRLEHQLADSNLEVLKLTRANDALQEDNINFSIALSAKQLELGMVKRNARFALKNAQAQAQGNVSMGLPVSKAQPVVKEGKEEKREIDFPIAPKGEIEEKRGDDKENQQPQQNAQLREVNSARQHARQLLAARRANGAVTAGDGGQERRQRLALAA
ncbi:uncharacterized protein UHOD_03833 [Ustilago sp. UG-2017b]|nr:uncharacterized protein UHOD_03833 [Ustilago sp. UG-2017b]